MLFSMLENQLNDNKKHICRLKMKKDKINYKKDVDLCNAIV